ncbi:MAG: MTH938/NDUFAF3 family protein [Candidatus Pacearchaeota archaeon]
MENVNIEKFEFGRIVVNGKEYKSDIFIFADGKVESRSRELSQKKYGTGHYFCKEEIEKLLKDNPEILIFGCGEVGYCKIEDEGLKLLKKLNIEYKILPTQKAIEIFNKTKGKKAGIFHVTC